MTKRNLMKQHLSDVLMGLVETRRLTEITTTELIDAAGVARQTFYNHFSDLDDLICYTASRALLAGDQPIYAKENLRKTYEYALGHRAFFEQLPDHTGYYGFRESTVRWLKATSYPIFIDDGMPAEERAYRKLRLDLYFVGEIDVVLEWFASGMEQPVDVLLEAVWDSAPAFMKRVSDTTPSTVPDYPR